VTPRRGGQAVDASWRRAGIVAAVVLVVDQVTKALVSSDVALGSSRQVIPGVSIVHAENSGVAFSLLTGSEALVVIFTVVIVAGVIAFFARHRQRRLLWLATGLIVGGALGNLVDRIRSGAVTDFIQLPHWPAFNLADASITVGVAALTLAIVKANDWGWRSPGIIASVAITLVSLTLFVVHCLRSANPFVDPAMFRIRQYTGAALVMAPYSVAFGAMLLSTVLWDQTIWGWSALKTGLAIAIGPLLVPTTSLLLGGRLIARFGAANVIVAGIAFFAAGMIAWATLLGSAPDIVTSIAAMAPVGIGVGLTFPTAMGVGSAALPPSMFATGSGTINMIRQSALAIGVAIFVAIVGAPHSPAERLAGFQRGWWVLAAIVALALIPTLVLIRPRRQPAPAAAERDRIAPSGVEEAPELP